MIEAKIIKDSVNLKTDDRLTTFELTYPRFIHAQVLTHRVFSRNAASSRAIPTQKMIEMVKTNPVVPLHWGRNEKGMQASEELSGEALQEAQCAWGIACDNALAQAEFLHYRQVHKQIVNRILEPFMHITVIVSATEYQNFFKLRCDDAAQPEIQDLACRMRDLYTKNEPEDVDSYGYHIPYVNVYDPTHPWYIESLDSETPNDYCGRVVKVATARCARVSYLCHSGIKNYEEDIRLHDQLATSGHYSPFEHVARALSNGEARRGEDTANFKGWRQYRSFVENNDSSF